MNVSRLFGRLATSLALVLLGMVPLWLLLGEGVDVSQGDTAQAAVDLEPGAYQASPDQDFFTCTSTGVAVFTTRIHVECSPAAPGNIRFFALGTSDANHTARTLSLLSMAHVTGKPLYIAYDASDTSGEAIGCQTEDCRLIQHAIILP